MLINSLVGILLIIASISDMKKRRISHRVLLIFGALIIPVFFINGYTEDMQALLRGLIGLLPGVLFLLLGKLTRESVGYGDGYMICIIGMYLGLKKTVVLVFIALFLISISSILLLLLRKVNRKSELPFVPALLAAFFMQNMMCL